MTDCKHPAWDLDEEGTLYCTVCDSNLSKKGKYKKRNNASS